MSTEMTNAIEAWLLGLGVFNPAAASPAATGLAILISLALAAVSYFVTEFVLVSGLTRWSQRTSMNWDDALVDRKVIHRAAFMAPILVLYVLAPIALRGHAGAVKTTQTALLVTTVAVCVWVLTSVLNAIGDVYSTLDASRDFPLRGPFQAAKLAIVLLGIVLAVSIILGRSPLYLLTGLGAISAVMMLVFKDPILGFVAGIQLSTNRMVAPGDWIEMPKYDADGDVLEVGLTTVKVRNWDKTVTMIPTYALVSESFKNWRGMEEAGGRRISRAINIDIGTIGFCTEQMLDRLGQIALIADYVAETKSDADAYNEEHDITSSAHASRRRLTNIGTFRAYVEAYLRRHPQISQDMTLLVRQLAPTEHGLPLQVYAFCSDTAWANYEDVQADIFDHLLAVVPEFGLAVFQEPTGRDFGAM